MTETTVSLTLDCTGEAIAREWVADVQQQLDARRAADDAVQTHAQFMRSWRARGFARNVADAASGEWQQWQHKRATLEAGLHMRRHHAKLCAFVVKIHLRGIYTEETRRPVRHLERLTDATYRVKAVRLERHWHTLALYAEGAARRAIRSSEQMDMEQAA